MLREIIIKIIKAKSVKRKDICKATGITEPILSNFIRGRTNLNMANLEKMLNYLNLCIAEYDEKELLIKLHKR
jgi:transcriptional regulator with XRE-family HTH domain